MIINKASLDTLFTGFQAVFKQGFDAAPSHYNRIAMQTNSNTREEKYGWLGRFPSIREWIAERHIENLSVQSFTIENKDYEATVCVDRNDIEDDRVGIYSPVFEHFGRVAKEHPDHLVFDLLSAGFNTACYDGQNFFDADHPVTNAAGATISVSNMQAGAGTPWFLFDTSKALRPLVFQKRKEFNLVRKDSPNDDNVFDQRRFIYGTDGRCSVGFGLWQLAYGSKAELTAANYAAARAAMSGLRGEAGRRLGIMPTLLVVPPTLEEEGLRLLKAQNDAAGASNPWFGTAELLVTPWLD